MKCSLCEDLQNNYHWTRVLGVTLTGEPDPKKILEIRRSGTLNGDVPSDDNEVCALHHLLAGYSGVGEEGEGCRKSGCRIQTPKRQEFPRYPGY